MAFSFSKFNKTQRFTYDTNGFTYATLADLYTNNGADKVYPLTAVYHSNHKQYGDAPILASIGFFVYVGKHMTETIDAIIGDDDAINAINSRQVGFKIYAYRSKKWNKDCFGVEFVDIDWNTEE